MHRKDLCQCGHLREEHNNRIPGGHGFLWELKYNCCLHMDASNEFNNHTMCPCTKFRLKRSWKEFNPKVNKPEVDSSQPLDVKQEGGNGVPPTLKSVGIPPTIL